MNRERFQTLSAAISRLKVGVIGDFCLDRYLEIDPAREETSLETGRPVHNVVNVRCQPGAAGTILNNLLALGVHTVFPVGFQGMDGEGFELRRALQQSRRVCLDYFLETDLRRTFTYTKPLLIRPSCPPEELNRLDFKNWSPTPLSLQERLIAAADQVVSKVDALIILDQVDIPETGVITPKLLAQLPEVHRRHPRIPILADSRRGLADYPPIGFKMNGKELAALAGRNDSLALSEVEDLARSLASRNRQPVFVTLAEKGILAASPEGRLFHIAALPVRGPIDIVGAGDAVTANLAVALAAGAEVSEAILIANSAASVVIHQLGTTGTASVPQIAATLGYEL